MARAFTPRVVVAHRPTEWDRLLERHATPGQARFFLESRDRDVDVVLERHRRQLDALSRVEQGIPTQWRRARVGRADFPGFLFTPEDIVVAVGQDGLVPNLAKYLDGQPVIGINPEPDQHEGTLVRFKPADAAEIVAAVDGGYAADEHRTMVQATVDDGQRLVALNEVYIGHRTHQSSRYTLVSNGEREDQSSSGLIVATGTGASGWARSIATERHTALALPDPAAPRLVFFVREAWPSVASGAAITEGLVDAGNELAVVSRMEEGGTVFGDGIEADRLRIGWGQEVTIGVAPTQLRMIVP